MLRTSRQHSPDSLEYLKRHLLSSFYPAVL